MQQSAQENRWWLMVVNDILIPLSYILLRIGYNYDDLIRFSSFDASFLETKGSLRVLMGKNVFLIALSSSQKQPSSYLYNINAEVIGFYIDQPLYKVISQKVRKYQKCSESFVEVQKRSQKSRMQYKITSQKFRNHDRSQEDVLDVEITPPPTGLFDWVRSLLPIVLIFCVVSFVVFVLLDFICFNWDES